MNRRENILATLAHQPHEHVGSYVTDVYGVGKVRETFDCGPAGGGFDGFGCKWATSASAMGAGVPAAGYIVLDDVTKWEDVVVFPDIDQYDWEEEAAIQTAKFDPENQIMEYGMFNGPFLRLTHLMGFEDGLCALYEEPEACRDLLSAITDYKIKIIDRAINYFHPDSICIFDDFATMRSPFISPDIYRDLLKPQHARFADAVRQAGAIPCIHICGKLDEIVPDVAEAGYDCWEVCQPENDLINLAREVGDRLAFMGGYDMIGKLSHTDPCEEVLRQSVRDTIEEYAPMGNFAIFATIMYSDIEKAARVTSILNDEVVKYGTCYYC